MCCLSLEVMNIFELLVVLNIELNHTAELMGLAYSQEFVKEDFVREMNLGLFQWGI